MRVLITGITGFVGTHLARELRAHDPSMEIWGLTWGEFDHEQLPTEVPDVHLVEMDLTTPGTVDELLARTRPDAVYHLAAASSVASSWTGAVRSLETNAVGTARLFDAVLAAEIDPVMLISSTSEIYGRVSDTSQPIPETARLAPVSPYGTSKAAQDLLAGQYHRGHGLATVRLRFFHLTGPGRPQQFAASSFARQIARMESGSEPASLRVGNLEPVRDFTDVRDAVRACRLACRRRHAGEVFNVCTGRGLAISEIVDMLRELTELEIAVEIDRDRARPSDIPWLVGDPSKIEAACGWRAEIPIERTLEDLLNWWRHRI
jgi:GDP-4-dehydro-6-deoxy-D-mannose reductase